MQLLECDTTKKIYPKVIKKTPFGRRIIGCKSKEVTTRRGTRIVEVLQHHQMGAIANVQCNYLKHNVEEYHKVSMRPTIILTSMKVPENNG